MSKTSNEKNRFIGIVVEKGMEGGGIGRSIGYLIDFWKKEKDSPTIKLFDSRGAGSLFLSPLFFIGVLLQIIWFRATGRLALLHVNLASRGSTWRNLILISWAALLHIPIVTHLHGGGFAAFLHETPRPLRQAIRWMFERSKRIIVLGESWANLLVEEVGVSRSNIRVIYNGVPLPKKREEINPPRDIPRILFLGDIRKGKGVHDLLAALADPETSGLKWKATLAGNGEIAIFKDMAACLKLSERIDFPGWVGRQETDQLLREADILVLPSYAEGLPMSVLEGLANKLAVVTTPVGAVPELLKDGETALLVPIGNKKKLAQAIQSLVKDRILRQKIAENGFAVFNDKINVSIVAEQIKAVYSDILH